MKRTSRWLRRALLASTVLATSLTAPLALAGPSSHMGPHAQALSDRSGTRSETSTQPHDAIRDALCPNLNYRKNVLITQFSRRELASSNAGNLYQVEELLPRLIGERLNEHPAIAHTRLLGASLPDSRSVSEPRLAQQVRELARTQGAQLVLSGEVIDMSMMRQRDSYNPTLTNRARNSMATALHISSLDSRQRDFVFQLTLRDGVTGEAVAQKKYHGQGVWAPGRPHQVGFGSPRFWRTDYGQKISELLDLASAELAEEVSCQPLVASLDLKGGSGSVILHSGTDQGLNAGDTLRLYQVVVRSIPGAFQVYRTHLVDSQIDVEVRELHGTYSVGQLSSDLDSRHGRYVALSANTGKELQVSLLPTYP
ncbi:flagella assembly protein FlgT middle domain-containing protein [Marinimicrobium sp. ABcell2]|uniref:flagella assembly protein FlgT middle domain-containing protein n=1 Tax=Marinimicrobium sp. ABcell2 TaxID=3069751 RepID=UPI0027B62E12|nr:flagella assembly protein FlgT middle domain-containing protein [Marinimicrobium sp. ABcell2]MDQ2076554.1 flagella assembly protein FlgT middle domain-containing protein [Marinimicrobium sp. ABcell2]